mmetsp:Transcript_20685/g.33352  ORF Transcript_20685/g.33352 Transcript_20685/m.33352 type:complete len:135 (+) Transcript_20685:63-467(+)
MCDAVHHSVVIIMLRYDHVHTRLSQISKSCFLHIPLRHALLSPPSALVPVFCFLGEVASWLSILDSVVAVLLVVDESIEGLRFFDEGPWPLLLLFSNEGEPKPVTHFEFRTFEFVIQTTLATGPIFLTGMYVTR